MKVLFLQHGLGFGGATKSLILMQQALKNDIECYTVHSCTLKKNRNIQKEFYYTKEIVAMDIPSIYSYSEGTMNFKDFERSKCFFPYELIKYINEKKIDILHINSTVFSNIIKQVKENTACKIVVHLREMLPFGSIHPIDAYIIENYTKYADAIISISDNESKFFEESKNLNVIANAHDFENTDKLLKNEVAKKEKIIIGMCANFKPIKGHLYFLEAAKLINERMVNFNIQIEYRIIGYPKKVKTIKELAKRILSYGYKSQFDKKIKSLKLQNIKIIPFTFEINQELMEFDIYVRPDISGNPWGRDIIEAMSLKKTVVATGESEFYIKNGSTGYLVPIKDPSKMAERIIELINDKNKRYDMGNAGYTIIKSMCGLNNYKNKIMEVYQSII